MRPAVDDVQGRNMDEIAIVWMAPIDSSHPENRCSDTCSRFVGPLNIDTSRITIQQAIGKFDFEN